MNFLGHLYFSGDDVQLQYANLYGDFVKGRDLSHYSSLIQRGIVLHRAIDTYIDTHPGVLDLMHQLYEQLPKVTGIAIDLYFDHLLAKNWSDFHSIEYDTFLKRFYSTELESEEEYSTEFLILIAKMKQKNWMHYYQYYDGLIKMCNGLSSRISFPNELPNAPEIYTQNEDLITKVFHNYMDDARPYFKRYLEDQFPELT